MSCPIPKIIEKQKKLLCGKHAINNLLQNKVADCNKLKAVGKKLSKELGIVQSELLNVKNGYYDISVLVQFLEDTGFEVIQLPKERFDTISRRQSSRLIGYIFGDGGHWIAVRKTQTRGCYFEIDSLQDQPIKINIVKKWLLENDDNLMAIKVLKRL
jgi:hypothetical protein